MNVRNPINLESLKDLLGGLPLVPEVYWYLRQPGKPVTAKFALDRLQKSLPTWATQARTSQPSSQGGKQVVIFATLRYWVEQVTAIALALAGQGNSVTLAFSPFAAWQKPLNRFDLRRQNVYAQNILGMAGPLVKVVSFLNGRGEVRTLPELLDKIIQDVALKDTQYTLQQEQVDLRSELFALRLERNREAAGSALSFLKINRPDVVIIPNGTILEFAAVYQAAKWLGIPVNTFEFGEQRQRVWLAQNAEVMRQDTTALWEAHQHKVLTEDQLVQVRHLFSSRQRASLWENFARRWQGVPSEGGDRVRAALNLDNRPLVLLATNVIGDSLTLGRQVFSDSMTEWLQRSVEFFSHHPEVQLVIRIHPGELITKGPSVADVVKASLEAVDDLPVTADHIHLVPAEARINTYDLVELADIGLVYTTTVGLEMAMSGIPVIVVGNTHYRGRGFTLDPESWDGYFEMLIQVLHRPDHYRLSYQQVNQAWNYAYRFFFEYPLPFPWHLVHFWEDISEWPIQRVLSSEGREKFGQTFRNLAGEPITWI